VLNGTRSTAKLFVLGRLLRIEAIQRQSFQGYLFHCWQTYCAGKNMSDCNKPNTMLTALFVGLQLMALPYMVGVASITNRNREGMGSQWVSVLNPSQT
jgi:hypothetical protein